MKKIAGIFLVLSCILVGCKSPNKPDNSVNNQPSTDTSNVQAAMQQPVDTTVKQDGELIRRYPNGIIKERSFYLHGRRKGECQSFYSNGKLWSDDYFTDGIKDGSTTTYFDNGQKRYEGAFIKGKPSGTWNFYNLEGKLVRTINYDKNQDKPAM